MKFGTKAIHAGVKPDPATGAIMTPIYQTSTFVQSAPGVHKGFEYARTQNPTRQALEQNIADLENGSHGMCFASGLAAIDAVLKLLNPGDEVIATDDLYGGTVRLFNQVYRKFGIKFHYLPLQHPENLKSVLSDRTKLVWLETPTNPMMNIIDIKAIVNCLQHKEVLVAVDNTFATPYLQQPLDLGADIALHSATKYLGGHSDVIMGAIAVKNQELYEKLSFIQNAAGAVPGPNDCFLVLRGIKTLHVRMQRHCENAARIAQYLVEHPKVDMVYWPGLHTHRNHAVAREQMRDFGGMISFSLRENEKDRAFEILQKFSLFSLAESLGGVESLCGHPATMTHASIPKEDREKIGLKDSLIRLSVGLEDVDDLIDDLQQALA